MHKPVGLSLRCMGLNNAQTYGDVIKVHGTEQWTNLWGCIKVLGTNNVQTYGVALRCLGLNNGQTCEGMSWKVHWD